MQVLQNFIDYINRNFLLFFILLLLPVFIWSVTFPHSMVTWVGESFLLFIGLAIMLKTYKSFPLSTFSYALIYIGACLILIGAHYSYAHVPLFDWLKSAFGFDRNNYDKLGHFFQGLIPVIVIREYFFRKSIINSDKWIEPLAITFSISLSAVWELLEWLAYSVYNLLGFKQSAVDFLGTQNYFWDAQSDILFATAGALTASIMLRKYHNESIKRLLRIKLTD